MANTPVLPTANFPHKLFAKLSPILSSGDFHHGDNLEQMAATSSSAKLYSIRLNRKSRVMLARLVINGVSSWLLLEESKKHYKDAQSLKKGWLDQYLQKNGAKLAKEHRELLLALQNKPEEPIGELEYHNEHWVVLSDEQNKAHFANFPLIVPGMPGTGKSVLALSLLKRELDREVESDDNNAPEVLYVTKSKELTDRMRVILEETPELASTPTVLDFASLPQDMRAQPEGQATGEAECMEWLAQAKLKLSWKELGYDSAKQLHRSLYREFRILSGCADEEAYDELGRRQSLFDKQQRAEIYQAYTRYTKSEQGVRDYSLRRIKPTTDRRYKAIFVDESQDFSDAELLDLYDLSGGRIVYFIDSNQSLLDVHSKIDVIKRRFNRELEIIILPFSFRCSNAVTGAANALLDIKHEVMGGVLEKNAVTHVKNHAGAEKGQAIWVEHQQKESSTESKDLDALKQTMNSTKRIVVTWPKYFEEVKRLFPGAIVATPEQVKGLEYDEVVAYHLLDEEHFTPISRLLPAEGSVVPEKLSRAKAEHDRRELGPDLNQVFTAFTRACKTLYVMEDSTTYKTKILKQRMKQAFTQEEIKTTLAASSPEEWYKQAQKFVKEKRYDLAQQICDTHLGAGVYESLVPGHRNDNSSASTTDVKPTPSITAEVKESNPEHTTHRQTKPKKSSRPVVASSQKKNPPVPTATQPFINPQEAKKTQEKLISAIKAGNLTEVKKQIKHGANPHQLLVHNITPMLIAADAGHLDIVEYLHQLGGDLSHTAADGYNVLAYAIQKGNLPLVKYCHQAGMYLNLRFKAPLGLTPLVLAIRAGDFVTVRYLCESGVNPNKKTQAGVSPLVEAMVKGSFALVQYLCDKGANPNLTSQVDDLGVMTPMHRAVLGGALKYVEYLHQKGASLEATSHPRNHTPLHFATANGLLDITRYFMRHSSWINSTTDEGETPLIAAAVRGHLPVVAELAANGVDLEAKTLKGITALNAAVVQGHLDIVNCLHAKGANLNALGRDKKTALHLALLFDRIDIANYLLHTPGVILDAADEDGDTPAHYAAKRGHFGVLSLLAKAKVNFNVLNLKYESPVHLAKDNNTLKMLKAVGANFDVFTHSYVRHSPLYKALMTNNLNRAQCLMECGARARPADNYDVISPILFALLIGNREFIELFLKNKTDVSTPFLITTEFFKLKGTTTECMNKFSYFMSIKNIPSTEPMAEQVFQFFKPHKDEIELTANELVWLMSRENLYEFFPTPDYLVGYGAHQQAANP